MYKFNAKEHIHTLNDKPLRGTSTVTGIVAKPLTWWASGKACEVFGWVNPKKYPVEEVKRHAEEVLEQIKGLDTDSYLSLLTKAYRAHNDFKETRAEEGTDLHAEIEGYVNECLKNDGIPVVKEQENIQRFIDWAVVKVDKFLFSEMHCYSERYWLGGITDFGYLDKEGRFMIGDIKSSREAYFSQFLQASLYGIQIAENGGFTSDGEKVFEPRQADGYAIFPFGADAKEPTLRFHNQDWVEAGIGAVKLYELNQVN